MEILRMMLALPMISVKSHTNVIFELFLGMLQLCFFLIIVQRMTGLKITLFALRNIDFSFLYLEVKGFRLFFFKLLMLLREIRSRVVTKREMGTAQVIDFVLDQKKQNVPFVFSGISPFYP